LAENNKIIAIENVEKIYEIGTLRVPALQGINVEIEEGDFIAIMGPSGSGKSTLMHILGCLDKPTSGTYYLKGTRVETLNDSQLSRTRNKEIGFVFQFFNLLPQINVLHNVELPLIYAGSHSRERRKLSERQLELVGLARKAPHLPNELSGGERQRVAIARALVNDPSILLADEPTGNLDTKTGHDIMTVFRDINRRGKTVIVVTHEREVAEFTNRIIHIRDGKVHNIEVLKQ
jgi:putative ABC transport system ATP-binding protein